MTKKQQDKASKFETLFHNPKEPKKRIAIPAISGYRHLETDDIVRCESDINYTTLFLKDKTKLVVAKTLKEFEEMLTEYGFFRLHNSHLVNLAFIKKYVKGKGGYVAMNDNSET